jgi:hypothetical protein
MDTGLNITSAKENIVIGFKIILQESFFVLP